jgi:predicted nucleic acid-binding protein
MSLIVDASVAVKWFSQETDSEKSEALLSSVQPLIAPNLVVAEIGNALWKKVSKRLLQREQAIKAMVDAPGFFDQLVSLEELAPRAIEMAIELRHPAYDCFYLALAERERAPIISADDKLMTVARKIKEIEIRML